LLASELSTNKIQRISPSLALHTNSSSLHGRSCQHVPDRLLVPFLPGTFSLCLSSLPSKDETFLTLSFGAEDKPNNNNFNNFLSEI
jgi:hypothetical protein